MEISEDLILSQILSNVYYREKVAPNLKSTYFEVTENAKVFDVIRHFIKNKVAVLDKITLSQKYNNEDKLNALFGIEFANDNIDWLINETEKWAVNQALKDAIIKSANTINEGKGNGQDIYNFIREALTVGFDRDLGLNWEEDIEDRIERYKQTHSRLSTGFQMFDYYTHGGIPRKTLTVIAGSSNLGKSNMLCNLACNFKLNGYFGPYITLELDRDEIARRCDSIMTGVPFYDIVKEKEVVIAKAHKLGGNDYFIKNYPPSKATAINLRTYIKELEIHSGKRVDYLIVDYINLMKPSHPSRGDNSYDKYFKISEELRELGVELNIPVITATQIGREGYGSSVVGMQHTRGSMGIPENADIFIPLTQSDEQAEDNLITAIFDKNRVGKRKVSMEIRFSSETLKIDEVLTDDHTALLEGRGIVGQQGPQSIVTDELFEDFS